MTTATVADKARTLTDPNLAALAAAPEKAEDLRTVEQVDWQSLITAALGPTTSIDLPLPQLLLRLASTVAALAENGEHLKHFTGATGRDQEDLAGSVQAALKRSNKKTSDTATEVERLKVRVEQLEAALTAPDDASKVQDLNRSATTTATR